MRGKDLRKPRLDRHAREAKEAEERLKAGRERNDARWAEINAAIEDAAAAARRYFAIVHPNTSTAIPLLDAIRLTCREVKEQRSINDEPWEKPQYGLD